MRKLLILLSVILLAAATSLPAGATVEQFIGVWETAKKNVKIGVRRIEITPDGARFIVQAWGACKKCDLGKTVGIPYAPHPRKPLADSATVLTAQFRKKNGKEITLVIRVAGGGKVTVEYLEMGKKPSMYKAVTQTLSKAR